MSNEHLILCGGAKLSTRQKAWRKAKQVALRVGEGGNLNLRISDLAEKLTANVRGLTRDLLEIATYVYCADQATRRGGTKELDYGQSWYRTFRFEIPVSDPDFWSSAEVLSDLTACLSDLSGDNFEFAFSRGTTETPEYFEFGEDAGDVDEVVLFSGGLDSFGGAVDEILNRRRKVALVSHRANSKIANRQKQLIAAMKTRVGDKRLAPVHVPVLVAKHDKNLNKEFTQRTRSFLYTSIAAIVARLFGLKRIRFYENGVTSLNLPISQQIVSSRATRSTHPKFLASACSLLSRLFPGGFGIENLFFWKTKTDILQEIKAAGHSDMCATTVSCAHTWEMKTQFPHCGKCSQCVDRRLATLAASYNDQEDPAKLYRFKLFTDSLEEPLDRLLVEAFVEVINRIERCDDAVNFCVEFPEVSRVLNYVQASADDTAQAICDLYMRHAKQVAGALDAEGAREFPRLRRGEIPGNCLIGMMGAGLRRDAVAGRVAVKQDKDVTERPDGLAVDEGTFSIVWRGRDPIEIGNTKEFRLMQVLALEPNKYHPHADLAEKLGGDQLDDLAPTKSRLVKLLKDRGYDDLAELIKTQKGHYGLFLS